MLFKDIQRFSFVRNDAHFIKIHIFWDKPLKYLCVVSYMRQKRFWTAFWLKSGKIKESVAGNCCRMLLGTVRIFFYANFSVSNYLTPPTPPSPSLPPLGWMGHQKLKFSHKNLGLGQLPQPKVGAKSQVCMKKISDSSPKICQENQFMPGSHKALAGVNTYVKQIGSTLTK